MNTPLDVAMDIGRIVAEAEAAQAPLDLACCVDDLLARFPASGVLRQQVLDALAAEAGATGISIN